MDVGLQLEQSSGRDGPDICIKTTGESRIWIEAVTASSGQGDDTIQEAEPGVVKAKRP